ncbi:MAG: hypothetical protein EON58_16425 [Alphaproteobacteria bacterium]|nr:MAG: hypothetical protein EON58_16425 [Alphaproteobacteria bacterium]
MAQNLTRLGVNLGDIAQKLPTAPCGCIKPRRRLVTHHDHILDLARELFQKELGSRLAVGSNETLLSRWCRDNGPAFYAAITSTRFGGGRRLVRFNPMKFCESCNTKDGNGKSTVSDANIRWYSMTPKQLADVAAGRKSWNLAYRDDRKLLQRRVSLMTELVQEEVARFTTAHLRAAA